ncbi:bifunctional diaminohydroxyphosphoribosylaminopyrimidine deaminase/5-amino-6-(5-phosphoribosylamino)uracil reductase RibD [Pedobacter sp. BS3]|uniref:bifunctional diaminohydroxyphosphoribosylaminopyrimidine deaminase/5-amino-6-(5-phosphoribosylamino)uracil reductase RibD n=1 Tax=Pedobacter sp. BS3 TaxID=2567937 RepID=UPI0011EDA792|nr:bifunctional diaminohydroxyphosphoribosylaminopyrimidine deaminase/5-amino-6-(5-phosphoribosylamino)uracil reductase RibD [Pedobacter sp. BS3]TZF84564.1 bifunctional diaminohydroxyphosphoribosylaminopyrimidine deaminase/5-amino-6-(5-phosphoribosylamino)uracil reductase RibD [Pedobacter sp. BS3]
MNTDERYMQRCIELARLGMGSVSPNPMVGAVVVHRDRIIGEGWHRQFGQAHAEVNAITHVFEQHDNGEELLRASTLYVCLEPCAHFGKTPPCSDLIIRHNIPKVVIGCRDPFDAVDGKGIEKLRNAGVEVVQDVLKTECEALNKRFFTRICKQRPYIILKWAQTANGYFAPADKTQQWISGTEAKTLVHKWRSEEDAVLIGKNTALADNPQLTTRLWPGKNPIRIVIDRNLQLPATLHVFDNSADTIVFNALKTEHQDHLRYIEVEDFNHYLPQYIAYQLYLMDVQSVIIEGGAQTLNLFIKSGLWDEARMFVSPVSWQSGIPAPQINGQLTAQETIGQDLLQTFIPLVQ